jgi:enoyl-[acyl-carrier protein] reductase I
MSKHWPNRCATNKASLEATIRDLAAELGPQRIRVNAISAGPMQTLSARGIAQFPVMLKFYEQHAPLGHSCTLEELGAIATFLATDGAHRTGDLCGRRLRNFGNARTSQCRKI